VKTSARSPFKARQYPFVALGLRSVGVTSGAVDEPEVLLLALAFFCG
jgi:hypothetical protein